MTEYIFCVPDENQPIAGDSSVYYPDERDEPMCVREEIVRCRDCRYGHEAEWPRNLDIPADYLDCTGKLTTTWDYYNDEPQDNPVEPDGFCKWGERKSLSQ